MQLFGRCSHAEEGCWRPNHAGFHACLLGLLHSSMGPLDVTNVSMCGRNLYGMNPDGPVTKSLFASHMQILEIWIWDPLSQEKSIAVLEVFKYFMICHVDLRIYKGPKPLKPKLKPSTQRSQNVSKVGTRRWTLSVLQNWMRLKWKSLRNVSPEGFSASKLGKFREILWRFARKRWPEVHE